MKFPNDSGPIYQETIEGRLPVEPFNTFSNLVFLILLIYFGVRVYKNPKQHVFLAFVLPMIAISYIGGTIFHATRSHEIWLLLDWVPIMLLSVAAVIYFVFKIEKRWFFRLLLVVGIFALQFSARLLAVPPKMRISIGYTITAITMLTPIFWYLYTIRWKNLNLIVFTLTSFIIAITFRTLDSQLVLLPMGTHWLWHLFGGVTVFFLIDFIYKDASLNNQNLY